MATPAGPGAGPRVSKLAGKEHQLHLNLSDFWRIPKPQAKGVASCQQQDGFTQSKGILGKYPHLKNPALRMESWLKVFMLTMWSAARQLWHLQGAC